MPLNMVDSGTSGSIPWVTKQATPTGGVICPIITSNIIITPNQMGSKPRAKTVGMIMGKESKIAGMMFMIQPRIMYNITIKRKIIQRDMPRPVTKSPSTAGRWDWPRKACRKPTPTRISNSIPQILAASRRALANSCRVINLLARPMSRAPAAPMAPASTGVNKPE